MPVSRSGMRIRAGWWTPWSKPGAKRAAQILDRQQRASAHGAPGRYRAVARRRFPALVARDRPRCARGRLESRGRGAGTSGRRADAARLRNRQPCRCRTAARNSPRRCSMRSPACACSMPAPRRAARPCTSRSARRHSPSSSPSTTIRCASARVRENLERAGRDAMLRERRPAHDCRRRSSRTLSIACWWTRLVRPPA